MIQSKQDCRYYLEADRVSLGKKRKCPRIFGDEIWKFQILLRRYEYYLNCGHSPFARLYGYWLKWRFHSEGIRLGFSIPPNVFGAGLNIAHYGTIVVSASAKVGDNCRIHVSTNIGVGAGTEKAPILGNNIYIGPGAKLFGDIQIADNIAIGANAVVNKSFTTAGISIGGAPARTISEKGSEDILIKGTQYVSK